MTAHLTLNFDNQPPLVKGPTRAELNQRYEQFIREVNANGRKFYGRRWKPVPTHQDFLQVAGARI